MPARNIEPTSHRGGITTTDATLLDLSKRPKMIVSVRPKTIKGSLAIAGPISRKLPKFIGTTRSPTLSYARIASVVGYSTL
jgi:hypothetical protein